MMMKWTKKASESLRKFFAKFFGKFLQKSNCGSVLLVPLLLFSTNVLSSNVDDHFAKGYSEFKSSNFKTAKSLFTEYLASNGPLNDYALYQLALLSKVLENTSEARKFWQKLTESDANSKIKSEALFELALMDLSENNFSLARQRLKSLEKKMKGEPDFPKVLYFLIRAENHLNNSQGACKIARRLYSSYPTHYLVADWNGDLRGVKVGNKSLTCQIRYEDRRSRIKSLQLAGQDSRAKTEIDGFRSEYNEEYDADRLLANWYMNSGNSERAMAILTKHYKSKKSDPAFLYFFGFIAARGSDALTSVGSLYRAFQASPKSRIGREALFQAAFLSYQFQDYDGATRKFQEFVNHYSRSSMKKEAQWNLAWLQYLRGDYKGALERMQALYGKEKRHTEMRNKIAYWMGVTQIKLGQMEGGKTTLLNLAKDQSPSSFYGKLARQRLVQMPLEKDVRILIEGDDKNFSLEEDAPDKETDKDEDEDLTDAAAGDSDEANSEADTESDAETEDIKFLSMGSAKKVEKIRELIRLGFYDWARWELFEIEKKTQNKDVLKSLLGEYERVEAWNRSSFISEVYLGKIDKFGQYMFPQAYSTDVNEASKTFSIPRSLIWGIMRQESHYKKEALSPVGAMGLMQVMPNTGSKIAELLGDNNFQAKDLFLPKVGIRYGAKYLQRLSIRFNKNLPLVSAAYNAGPHRVNAWLNSFGNLGADEFIEHIPFSETRTYVKKVISNIAFYESMYDNKINSINNLIKPIEGLKLEKPSAKENWDEL